MNHHALMQMAKAHQDDMLRESEKQRVLKQIKNRQIRHAVEFRIVELFKN